MKVGKWIVWICALVVLASSSYAVLDTTKNMLYWGLNGNLLDNSSYGHDGTATGDPTSNTGVYKLPTGSYEFDGDDYVSNGDLYEPDARTINFWIRPTSVTNGDTFFGAGSDSNNYIRGYVNAGSNFEVVQYTGGAPPDYTITSTTTLSANTWYMITVHTGTSGADLYINGVLEDSDADTTKPTSGWDFDFGDTNAYAVTGMKGQIDEVSIWNATLNVSDIRVLYNDGNGFTPYISTEVALVYPCFNSSSTSNLTFNFINETDNNAITSDITGNIVYYNSTYSDSQSFTYSGIPYLSLCNNGSSTDTIFVNYTLYYERDTYPQRTYIEDEISIGTTHTDKYLYLLEPIGHLYGYFKVLDGFDNPISGVQGDMSGTISGNYRYIASDTSGDSGLLSIFQDPDKTHSVYFTKTGYQPYNLTDKFVTSDIYTIYLSTTTGGNITYTTGTSYTYSPKSPLQNTTAYNFSVNVTSTYWDMDECDLYLYNSTTLLNSTNGTRVGDTCYMSLRINTHNFSSIIMNFTYELDNATNITEVIGYIISYEYQGNFSLKTFIDDVNNFSDSGFDNFTRAVLGLILVVVFTGMIARTGDYFKEPESLILIFLLITWIVSYVGWFTLNYPPILGLPSGTHLAKYMVFYMLLFAGGSYLASEVIRR